MDINLHWQFMMNDAIFFCRRKVVLVLTNVSDASTLQVWHESDIPFIF